MSDDLKTCPRCGEEMPADSFPGDDGCRDPDCPMKECEE